MNDSTRVIIRELLELLRSDRGMREITVDDKIAGICIKIAQFDTRIKSDKT